MQALCHLDAQSTGLEAALTTLADESDTESATLDYARTLCRDAATVRDSLDDRIRAVLQHWDFNRLACVERNVLRVALVELIRREVPPKVAIDEAIEIARAFGSADSSGFVNGVLDAAWKKLQEQT